MYKLSKNIDGEINGVILGNTWIPLVPDNTDYQEYLKWVAEGNEPLPPDSQE